MARHAGTDQDLLAMALVGYLAQKARIEAAMAEIRAKLGHGSSAQAVPRRRTMSAAGRNRIAAAQRKRWAAARGKGASKPAAPKKRKLSAAARKKMGEATRKRWAAYRKAAGKKAMPVAKAAAS